MEDSTVWVDSVRSHLSDMLKELAELADAAKDEGLHTVAFRLRLLSGDPALRPRAERQVLLHCEQTGLSLIAEPQRRGDVRFRLERPSGPVPPVADNDLVDEKSAVRTFVQARAALRGDDEGPAEH